MEVHPSTSESCLVALSASQISSGEQPDWHLHLEVDSRHEQAIRHPWLVVFVATRPGHLPGPGEAIPTDRSALVPSWTATEGRTHGRMLHPPVDRCRGAQSAPHGACLTLLHEVCTPSNPASVRGSVGLAAQRVHRGKDPRATQGFHEFPGFVFTPAEFFCPLPLGQSFRGLMSISSEKKKCFWWRKERMESAL